MIVPRLDLRAIGDKPDLLSDDVLGTARIYPLLESSCLSQMIRHLHPLTRQELGDHGTAV